MESVRRADEGSAPYSVRRGELPRQRALTLLSGITLVGVLLRVLTLNSRSFWLDEATSVRQASWDLPMIFDRMSANVHPPLFHILLHYWIRIFGRSELAVRSYPLFFGILAIPLAYWAGTAIYNRRVGLFSAAILALSPYFIWYSQEARMYALMLVFAFLSLGSLFKALQTHEPRWWWLYALSTAAGMFTQFFFAFLILTQGLYVLVFLVIGRERELAVRGKRQVSWSRPWRVFKDCPEATTWLLCMIVVLLPLAWWIPQVLGHREVAATFGPVLGGSKGLPSGNLYQTLNYGSTGPQLGWHFNEIMLAASQAVFGMHSDTVSRGISAMWPLGITLAFLISGYMRRVSARTWYVIFTGVFGFAIIAIIGMWQPVYEVRYYMAVSAPLAVLFARLLGELRRPYVHVVCTCLVVLALASYVDQSYNPDSLVKWDNREAVSTIYKDYRPGDVILLIPYYASSILEYYLPPDAYFAVRQIPQFTRNGDPRNDPELLSQDLSRQVGPSRRVWVVSSFIETPRVQQDRKHTVEWLRQQGYVRVSDTQFHRIRVSLYEGTPRTGFFINQGGAQ